MLFDFLNPKPVVKEDSKIKLYDTNALMCMNELPERPLYICDVTLHELENIKSRRNYTDEAKYKARRAVTLLYNNQQDLKIVKTGHFDLPDDAIIDAAARNGYDLVTNDKIMAIKARTLYGVYATMLKEIPNEYAGYRAVSSDIDASLINDMLENEYIIHLDGSKNNDDDMLDVLGIGYKKGNDIEWIKNRHEMFLRSTWLGEIRPLDPLQVMAINSLERNTVTMLKGPAGTGKTLLALAYALQEWERGRCDRIFFFTNALPAKDTQDLGALPGDKDEKLMDTSVGNMLGSKLGSKDVIWELIEKGEFEILPLNFIRGMSIPKNSILIFDEAQNTSIPLMKLALQRPEEDCKVIIAGDIETQVDRQNFMGTMNGMRRASEVLRGHDFYGEVDLEVIHRSKLAEIVQQM